MYANFFSLFSSGPALLTGDTVESSRYFAGDREDNDVISTRRLSNNTSRLKYVSKVYRDKPHSCINLTFTQYRPAVSLAVVQAGKALFYTHNVN